MHKKQPNYHPDTMPRREVACQRRRNCARLEMVGSRARSLDAASAGAGCDRVGTGL